MLHFSDTGVMSSGVTRIDDYNHHGLYLFVKNKKDGNSYQASGFYSDPSSGKRYLFDGPRGEAHIGWYNTVEYPSNREDTKVYFNSDGTMAEGVTKIDDETYLFLRKKGSKDKNCYKTNGWYTDKKTGKRYYFDVTKLGKAVKGEQVINGSRYNFNMDGELLTR